MTLYATSERRDGGVSVSNVEVQDLVVELKI